VKKIELELGNNNPKVGGDHRGRKEKAWIRKPGGEQGREVF